MKFSIMSVDYFHMAYSPGIFKMLEMGSVLAGGENFLCYTLRLMDELSMHNMEAFNHTAQINVLLTPRLAHQLMWN